MIPVMSRIIYRNTPKDTRGLRIIWDIRERVFHFLKDFLH